MKIIDLTLLISNEMYIYPGDPKIDVEQLQTFDKDGWNMKRIHMNTHDGTHVNAPIHGVKDGKTLNNFEVSDFCGESILYENYSDIQFGIGILFQKQINMGIAEQIVKIKPKFVGLVVEVDEEIEKYLLKNDIMLFERLTNVDKLPKKFNFYGAPLKIKDGDGSPVRAFAIFI